MRLSTRSKRQNGDTIIEVIFAVAVFALVAVGSLAIMNQGIATGERSLEVTLVRQQIDAQAEALRYLHEARVATSDPTSAAVTTWNDLQTVYKEDGASPYGASNNTCTLPGGSHYKPFVLNARTAQIWSRSPAITSDGTTGFPPYPQILYNADSSIKAAYGLWVESVPSSTLVATRFVDFHIRACWDVPGSSAPMTIGTIVRLYDPA